MLNNRKSITLAWILVFGWFGLQSQNVGEPPELLKFGYNFEVHYSSSSKSHFTYFYNDPGDSVFIFNAESLDSGLVIYSRGWSHGITPVITDANIFVFPISENRLSMVKYSRDLELIDSVLLGIDANYGFHHEEDIFLVREYPYVQYDNTVLDSVAIYRITSGGDFKWSKTIPRSFNNISGALWTTNVCNCESYIAIVDPLTNEISVVNHGGKLVSRFQVEIDNKKKSWGYYMDSTYRSWGNEMQPGKIKKYLGQIMKWQKMTTAHVEQVFCDAGFIGVVYTENWTSTIKYFSPVGDLITEVFLDSVSTFHFLGKQVQIGEGEYVRLQMKEMNDSFKYVPEKFKSPRFLAKEQVILKDAMFCEQCIDETYSGVIVFSASNSMDKKIESARLLRKYPKSKPVCVKWLNNKSELSNKVLTLEGDELFSFLNSLDFY
jgi:hypothetical protein